MKETDKSRSISSVGRPAFIRALVAKLLAEGGRDPAAADIVEAGLRSRRDGYEPLPGGHQRPVTYYPGLGAQAWFDPQAFSWVADLEASAPAIREECLAQWRAGTFHTHPSSLPLTTGVWRQFLFHHEGHREIGNCALCPRTAAAIDRIPGAMTAGIVYFSVIDPGTRIQPHCGPHNARIRCHLGLEVPERCRIRVGAEARTWQQGKVIIFDESYEHEVWNEGESERFILIIDIWHPDLTADQIAAIQYSESPAAVAAYDVAKALMG